jgi:hypothetical protein
VAILEIGFGVVNKKWIGENETINFFGIKNGSKKNTSNPI